MHAARVIPRDPGPICGSRDTLPAEPHDRRHRARGRDEDPGRAPRPDRHLPAALAASLAARPARPAAPGVPGLRPAARRQARDHGDAVHLQVDHRRPGRGGRRQGRGRAHRPPRRADAADRPLRRLADRHVGADPGARRAVRQGGDARGAAAGAPDLRAHAPPVPALPPGAQDRRPDPGAGARPRRHRGIVAPDGADPGADHRRVRAGARRAGLRVQLDLRGDRLPDGRGLPGLHLQGDRVADRDPPSDERLRHRRQHQGGRPRCSTTRR